MVPACGIELPGHDPEQGGLAGSVGTDQRHLGAVADPERDVVEQDPAVRQLVAHSCDIHVTHERTVCSADGPGRQPVPVGLPGTFHSGVRAESPATAIFARMAACGSPSPRPCARVPSLRRSCSPGAPARRTPPTPSESPAVAQVVPPDPLVSLTEEGARRYAAAAPAGRRPAAVRRVGPRRTRDRRGAGDGAGDPPPPGDEHVADALLRRAARARRSGRDRGGDGGRSLGGGPARRLDPDGPARRARSQPVATSPWWCRSATPWRSGAGRPPRRAARAAGSTPARSGCWPDTRTPQPGALASAVDPRGAQCGAGPRRLRRHRQLRGRRLPGHPRRAGGLDGRRRRGPGPRSGPRTGASRWSPRGRGCGTSWCRCCATTRPAPARSTATSTA